MALPQLAGLRVSVFKLLFTVAVVAAMFSIGYRDSQYTCVIDVSELRSNGEGLEWPLDERARRIERFALADSLSSILFLGDRLIPLRTVHSHRSVQEVPWHDISGDELRIHLDHAGSSDLALKPLKLTMIGAYSNVRCWSCSMAIAFFVLATWLCPTSTVICLAWVFSRLDRLVWGLAFLIVLAAIASLLGWIGSPSIYVTDFFESRSATWFVAIVEALRRIESAGPGVCLSIACVLWVARMRAHRCEETTKRASLRHLRRIDRVLLSRPGLTVAVAFGLTALMNGWLGNGIRYPPDLTHYAAPLQGQLSWRDAMEYENGVQSILSRGILTEWNERRPINGCWKSVRYGLTGNYRPLAVTVEHAILALSAAFLVSAVTRRWGAASALATLGWVWGYSRWYAATSLSELLGLTLGCWATALLLMPSNEVDQGPRMNRVGCAFAFLGLTIATLAQTARPGAVFGLPLLGIVIAMLSGESAMKTRSISSRCINRIKWLGLAMALVLLALGTTLGLNSIYGSGTNQPAANLAHTLAGLSEGRNWSESVRAHEAELEKLKTEREISQFLYQLAWKNFQQQPFTFFSQFTKAYYYFFREFPGSLSRTAFPELGRWNLTKGTMLILLTLAFCRLFHERKSVSVLFLFSLFAGVLLSVPIIFLDGSWRALAATWPTLAVLVSAAFSRGGNRRYLLWRTSQSVSHAASPHLALVAGFLVTLFVGPAIVFRCWMPSTTIVDRSAEVVHVGDVLDVTPRAVTGCVRVGDSTNLRNSLNEIDFATWQISLQSSELENITNILMATDSMRNFSVFNVYDAERNRMWWVIDSSQELPERFHALYVGLPHLLMRVEALRE